MGVGLAQTTTRGYCKLSPTTTTTQIVRSNALYHGMMATSGWRNNTKRLCTLRSWLALATAFEH